ncbi:MAG: nitrous oxide-stimulated promoter family protein [Desulfuromonadales bacterium]|nr:nitrous oxide-stimulated promoter family protein [Desulfuromonadales bacterium]
METVEKRQKRDIRLIGSFVQVHCSGRHGSVRRSSYPLPAGLGDILICPDCAHFMKYVVTKRLNCPLEAEKPSCKHCRIHCYAAAERKKIREIMAYSGRRMIMRGRLDYLWHYLF